MKNISVDDKTVFLQEIVRISKINGQNLKVGSCHIIELQNAFEELSNKEFQAIVKYLIKFNYLIDDCGIITLTGKGLCCIDSHSRLTQLLNTDTVSLCLLKKIKRLHKKQYKVPISKEYLVRNSPEFSSMELEEYLSKLEAEAYLDVSKEDILLTGKGISFIENNQRVKIVAIIIELVVAISGIYFLVSSFV